MNRPFVLRFPLPILAFALAFALALIARPVAADGIIIPRPPLDRPIPWREVPLAIKYHRVTVTIDAQVATTKVDQVFVNEASFPVEGTYMFPLPEDAAISSFDMWVDGQKLEGKLLGREEARAIYEEIVRQQKDPALLEYVGRGAFQASIFPIPPGGERRIELTYSQVLAQDSGLVHYRYPLNTEKFSARDIQDVSVTVTIADLAPLRAVYSPSHPVQVVRDGERRATASYEAHNVRPDRDFDLYFSLSPDAIAVNLLSYKPYAEDGFFLLLVTPPVNAPQRAVAKDVVLVLDTSGSMDGEKIQQAKTAAAFVLDHLGASDRFNIVAFSSATRLFAERPVSSERRAEAHQFIKSLVAAGSTDINRALLEALAGADPERPTVVIFLTDGLPTAGETNPDRIVANVQASAPRSVRLFAFGVGYDVDVTLLDELSGNQRGVSSYVRPGSAIDEEVSGFYAKVSAPVLVDVDMTFNGVRVEDLYPYPLPDLFMGSQLVVVGRYRQGGPTDLKLTGSVNGRPESYTYAGLTFVTRGGNEFIPRLWAQRKIGYLLTQIRLKGASDELVKEVVALSTRFGIVTPYTSFLVEEPRLALSQAGRDQLERTLQATQAVQAPGATGGAAAPRSGEAVVEKSVAEQALQAAEQAAAPAASSPAGQMLRQVGAKTFLFDGMAWVDTAYDGTKTQAEVVVFGSDRYFAVLAQYPEIGPYLALGERVTVILAGQAFAIQPGANGDVPAPAVQDTPAAPVTSPTAVEPATTPALTQPVTPATSPIAPPLCPAGAAIGLVGIMLPAWRFYQRYHR